MLFFLAALALAPPGSAQIESDLAEMSLEQLLQLEVTSVSRREQQLSRAPAAIYVITHEEIRRSGLRSLPELLRLVPGVHVGRIDAYTWAISARGFNGRISNKMLVLIDGRTVYTPLFSGVYWEMHDLVLEDIERIEVIRGPGATMWGANAVNGVVNVITKSARDTQGGLVEAGGGNVDRVFGSVRYGGKLGGGLFYRFYTKISENGAMRTSEGKPAGDDWRSSHSGLRIDWDLTDRDVLTIMLDAGVGDFHRIANSPTLTPPAMLEERHNFRNNSSSTLLRWTRHHSGGSVSTLQAYFDRYDRRDPLVSERRGTLDIEYQMQMPVRSRHLWSWGAGLRTTGDNVPQLPYLSISPARTRLNLMSTFVQDDISLADGQVVLTFGSKFERHELTGLEVQPTARLFWEPAPNHSFWASVSRATHTPSRGEHDSTSWVETIPGSPETISLPAMILFVGNPGYGSQHLTAIEAGWRYQPHRRLSTDVAVFFSRYGHLRFLEPGAPELFRGETPHLVVPMSPVNGPGARTWGAEILWVFDVNRIWTLTGNYSWMHSPEFQMPPALKLAEVPDAANHLASLRSQLDLPGRTELDTMAYFVDGLRGSLDGLFPRDGVPSAVRVDARLSRSLTEQYELSVVAQDLLNGHRTEFTPEGVAHRAEVRRSVYAQFRWHF